MYNSKPAKIIVVKILILNDKWSIVERKLISLSQSSKIDIILSLFEKKGDIVKVLVKITPQ